MRIRKVSAVLIALSFLALTACGKGGPTLPTASTPLTFDVQPRVATPPILLLFTGTGFTPGGQVVVHQVDLAYNRDSVATFGLPPKSGKLGWNSTAGNVLGERETWVVDSGTGRETEHLRYTVVAQ